MQMIDNWHEYHVFPSGPQKMYINNLQTMKKHEPLWPLSRAEKGQIGKIMYVQ